MKGSGGKEEAERKNNNYREICMMKHMHVRGEKRLIGEISLVC